ncbi:MAG: MATE family efflux transporter [Lachnospiraceae bacterium]|nr:MATE family efflux transporter [Lachnospiraceae bacterium]
MKRVDFGSERVASNIMQTALPLLVAQLLQLLYNIVDRVYIGRIPGEGTDALGAVGLVFPVIIIITGLTNLFGMGASPLFSIALGAGDTKKADDILHTAFRLMVCTAVVVFVCGEYLAAPLLTLFGADETLLPIALPYARIYLCGTLFTMTASGLNPFINAQGFPRIGMLTIVIGAVTNLVLDPVFIFVLGLGVRGAAIATVLAQSLSFFFVLSFFRGKKTQFRLKMPWYGGDALKMFPVSARFIHARDIVGLGFASFVMQATNSLVQIACNNALLAHGGAIFVSVMTVVASVRNILDTPPLAVADGTAPLIGFNYGARHGIQIKKAVRLMTLIGVSYTFAVWLLVEWRAEAFVRIFTDDTTLFAPAAHAMRIYFRAFVFQALQYSGQSVFKALGFKKQAIFFSIFRKVVLVVPLIYLLSGPLSMGTDGVFRAEPVSNIIGGTACFVTMLFTLRRVLAAL